MATAMIYDTLKLAEQLEHEAGFDAPRAKAMARILAENTGGNLATREDLLVTKTELQAEIQGVRSEVQDFRAEVCGKMQDFRAEVRGEIQDFRAEVRGEIQDVRAEVRGEIQDFRAEVQGEIQDVRGDIRVLYWMSGTTLAGVAGLLSIAITIALHLMHLG